MKNYTATFKKKVVENYLRNGLSHTKSVYNVDDSSIYKWVRRLKGGKGLMRKKSESYSLEKKLEILSYYRKHGKAATKEKYDIEASVFYKWERILHEKGEAALAEERRGRPKKKVKKDVNQDKDLLEENRRLRLEVEYLKKLDALVREREEREKKKK